ncbi:MAG TPA: hypothetical protein VFA89_08830 [Terriglobales bacterium]|nr:hypothetical protein [Terriglobales bacterium]
MRFRNFPAFSFACLLLGSAVAQQSPSATTAVNNEFVQKAFGETCTVLPGPAPLKADLDGDGVEDLVIAARCKNPLPDQADYNFKVVDPYNSFYGFGDVKITSAFSSEDPDLRGVSLLIIHGAGADAWHSATPKAKFLVINLPFKQLRIKKMSVHKKTVMAIYAEESREGEGTVSALYWDGKKYKYQPVGTSME